MQRLIQSVAPMRDMLYKRAMTRFLENQKGRGVEFSGPRAAELLGEARTVAVDAALLLQGEERVRAACAPLAPCPVERLKKQPCWMMLTAAVALGCAEYAPLERFAEEMSFAGERMARQYPLVERIPYDDARGIETTLHREGAALRSYAKGAPASVLARCQTVQEGKERPLTSLDRARALEAAAQMEQEGFTALAFATKPLPGDASEPETDMAFLGMVAVGDAPREDAGRYPRALEALVRPVVMSQKALPEGLLRRTGLLRAQAGLLTGAEAERLDEASLVSAADACDAFVDLDETQRRRVAAALRMAGRAPVIAVGPEACGDVTVSLCGGEADACLSGGPEMLASLLRSCRTFLAENGKA